MTLELLLGRSAGRVNTRAYVYKIHNFVDAPCLTVKLDPCVQSFNSSVREKRQQRAYGQSDVK